METGDCPPLNMNVMQSTSVKSVLNKKISFITNKTFLLFQFRNVVLMVLAADFSLSFVIDRVLQFLLGNARLRS